jgi:hypothetical protein
MATLRSAAAELLPVVDSTANANTFDVIGRKDDAAQTTVGATRSIVAIVKGILSWITVPSTNATTNTNISEVVGSKADTAKTTADGEGSLIRYIKGILSLLTIPTADATTNTNHRDVIGNKEDAAVTTVGTTKSAMAYLKGLINEVEILTDHIHGAMKVYPTLAAGVTVTGNATAWTLGNATEIVPANTITSPFDIHFIEIEAVSATDVYEVVLYSGASADVEIGRFRTSKDSANTSFPPVSFMCPLQPANTKISAKCASSGGGGDTITISIGYHLY